MSAPERLYRNLTLGFSVVIIAFGLVILVQLFLTFAGRRSWAGH
jgi:hypothetical protein